MAIKSCLKRIATNCYGTQTIQPTRASGSVTWVCPECARMLRPDIKSINLTEGGKDAKGRLTALRARRAASGR